jgi:hypothetical protein
MPCALLVLAFLAPQSVQSSSSFQDLAQELGSKISAEVGPADEVMLTVVPAADGDQAAILAVEAEMRRILASRGIRIVERGDVATALQVGCGKNLRERVCACEVRRGATRHVLIVTRPLETLDHDTVTLSLQLTPLFSQRAPILDLIIAGDRLLVLDPERVTLYERVELEREASRDPAVERDAVAPSAPGRAPAELAPPSGERTPEASVDRKHWKQLRSKPIAGSRPWPRDARGMLGMDGATVTAWLPGSVCRGSADLVRFVCADEHAAAWPIGIGNTGVDAARNNFYTPEGLPFYSAAPLGPDPDARWLVVAATGELLLLDAARRTVGTAEYGDAVVALDTVCATGTHVLVASSAKDEHRSEVLQLWRVVKRQLVPVATPIGVQGRLTALWPVPGSAAATAVTHDAAAERYEAFHVRIACSF